MAGEIEPVRVHDLVPGRHEISDEFLVDVGTPVNFRKGTELRVRSEDQIDTGSGPLLLLRLPVTAFVCVVAGLLPLRVHVEQVDEEVVRQFSGSGGKDAV